MNKLMVMGGVALAGLTLCGATNETATCGADGVSAQTNAVATDFESCIRVVADTADALEREWSDVDER